MSYETAPFEKLLNELDDGSRMEVMKMERRLRRLETLLREVSRDGESPEETLMRVCRQIREYQKKWHEQPMDIQRRDTFIAQWQRYQLKGR